jgi:WD40 repeat protein
MSAGVSDDWYGWSDRGFDRQSQIGMASRKWRLPLLNWKSVVLLGTLVAATACFAGECPCSRVMKILPRATLTGHVGTVGSVVFQPGGSILSSVGLNGSTVLWNLETQEGESFSPVGPGQDHCIAFSSDGRLLATGSPTSAVALHDLESDEPRPLIDPSGVTAGAECLAFSPDGASLAVGQQDGRITFWDVATKRARSDLAAHREFVASLAYSPDGTKLASSGGDRTVRLWDLATARQRFEIPGQPSSLVALAFSPDSWLLALADQRSPVVQLVEVATGSPRMALRGPKSAVVSLAISPDGTTLAAADLQGAITFWDLATYRVRTPQLTHKWVYSLAFAPDGRSLASGGVDGAILIWDWPLSSTGRGW